MTRSARRSDRRQVDGYHLRASAATREALADGVIALEELGEVLFRGQAVAVPVFAVMA